MSKNHSRSDEPGVLGTDRVSLFEAEFVRLSGGITRDEWLDYLREQGVAALHDPRALEYEAIAEQAAREVGIWVESEPEPGDVA